MQSMWDMSYKCPHVPDFSSLRKICSLIETSTTLMCQLLKNYLHSLNNILLDLIYLAAKLESQL